MKFIKTLLEDRSTTSINQFIDNLIEKYSESGLSIDLDTEYADIIAIKNIDCSNLDIQKYESPPMQIMKNILNELIDFSDTNKFPIAISFYNKKAWQPMYWISLLERNKFFPKDHIHTYTIYDFSDIKLLYPLIRIPKNYKSHYVKKVKQVYVPEYFSYDLAVNSTDTKLRSIIESIRKPITLKKLYNLLKWPNTVNYFSVMGLDLTSMEYCPAIINGNLNASQNALTSFEGFPKYISGNLNLHLNPIKSFHNIHMHINHIGGKMIIPVAIESHIMGLMKIQGLKSVEFKFRADHLNVYFPEKIKAIEIINRHLDGKGNFFDCLEELEDAGLEEFAQL